MEKETSRKTWKEPVEKEWIMIPKKVVITRSLGESKANLEDVKLCLKDPQRFLMGV